MSLRDECMEEEMEELAKNGGCYFPDIDVQLVGANGNAFNLVGIVNNALRKGGATPEDINFFTNEAMSGNYEYLLQTCARWVNVT